MANEVVGGSYLDADLHEVVASINFIVAWKPTLPARHEANLFHTILRICIKSLQTRVQEPLSITRMDVVSKDDTVCFAVINTLYDTVLSLIR